MVGGRKEMSPPAPAQCPTPEGALPCLPPTLTQVMLPSASSRHPPPQPGPRCLPSPISSALPLPPGPCPLPFSLTPGLLHSGSRLSLHLERPQGLSEELCGHCDWPANSSQDAPSERPPASELTGPPCYPVRWVHLCIQVRKWTEIKTCPRSHTSRGMPAHHLASSQPQAWCVPGCLIPC